MPVQNQIDIVVTSYHRPQFTLDTLAAVSGFTALPHRVIVVDNGSDKQTVKMLIEAKDDGLITTLVLLDKNYGLEPAKNVGLSLVTSDVYVDTDNDILVPPPDEHGDWLSKLADLMDQNDQYAAIACPPQVFIGANKEALFMDAPPVKEWDKCGGSMRIMDTEAVRKAGGWRNDPKDMTEANRSEEWYICGKLRRLGYKVGYATNIEVFHQFSDDEEWGYGKDTPHYHRDIQPRPTDKQYGTKDAWYKKFGYSY